MGDILNSSIINGIQIIMNKKKIILIYGILLTIFTSMMVLMSIFSPSDFFGAYGISGDKAFQYSWSFRYVTVLLIMILGLIYNTSRTLIFTIGARLCIDIFDGIGVWIYNTPEYSHGWLAFHIFALIIPQIISLVLLARMKTPT